MRDGDGEDVDLTVTALGIDVPGDIRDDRAAEFRHCHVLVVRRVVEGGHVCAVVLTPIAVLVSEDGLPDQRPERILVERPEGFDREVDEACEILQNERTKLHESAFR